IRALLPLRLCTVPQRSLAAVIALLPPAHTTACSLSAARSAPPPSPPTPSAPPRPPTPTHCTPPPSLSARIRLHISPPAATPASISSISPPPIALLPPPPH